MYIYIYMYTYIYTYTAGSERQNGGAVPCLKSNEFDKNRG